MSMDFTCRQSLNPTPIAGWAGLWVSFFHLFFHGIFQSTRSFSSSFFSYLFLGLNNLSFHFGGGKIYFSWENFGRVLSSSSSILFWWWFHGYWVLSVTNREKLVPGVVCHWNAVLGWKIWITLRRKGILWFEFLIVEEWCYGKN